MAHVLDGKLYLTRDQMQGNFIPKNLKLPEPKPAPKPQPKVSSSGSMCNCSAWCMITRSVPSRTVVGFASFITCANMGVNLKFSCSQGFLVFACIWKCGQRSRHTHTMRIRTCVSVVVCVARKLRPCPSYRGCRDRNNSVHWRSLYKGMGGGVHCQAPLPTVLVGRQYRSFLTLFQQLRTESDATRPRMHSH